MEVSVVIPVYNAGRFVADTVRSAMAQPEVAEVLLVEDGSTDNGLEVCQRLAESDPKVRLLRHPGGVNKGAGASRNLGMTSATKEFIAFLDADDLFLPDRFAQEHKIFSEHPDADGVYGAIGAHFHDEDLRGRFADTYAVNLTTVRHVVAPEHLFNAFLGLHPGIINIGHFSLDGLTLRRAALERLPMLMNESLRLRQDSEFIIRLSYHLRLYAGAVNRAVSSRGLHRGNRITNDDKVFYTSYLMFRELAEWARTEGLDRKRRQVLQGRAWYFEMLVACAARDRSKASRLMFAHPVLWKHLDLVQGYIDVLGGGEGPLTRGLKRAAAGTHAFLWKLKGGARSTPDGSGEGQAPSPSTTK